MDRLIKKQVVFDQPYRNRNILSMSKTKCILSIKKWNDMQAKIFLALRLKYDVMNNFYIKNNFSKPRHGLFFLHPFIPFTASIRCAEVATAHLDFRVVNWVLNSSAFSNLKCAIIQSPCVRFLQTLKVCVVSIILSFVIAFLRAFYL